MALKPVKKQKASHYTGPWKHIGLFYIFAIRKIKSNKKKKAKEK